MVRPKLTAEQLEARKEKERLRSQQRRQAAAKERQTRLFHEAGQTPTVRIIETEVAGPTHTANNTITNPRPQLGREDTREPTDITEESIDNQETATTDLSGPKQAQVKDCTINQGPVSSLSPAPAEQAQRYNLRARKSPTPTDQSIALRPSSSSSAANNRVRPDCFNIPLRPIANPNGKPRHASSRAQTSDEEEPHDGLQQCQVPPASLGAPNASARRVQQCRARQRALRREQHVLDANQRPNQVRVVSLPHDEAPHEAVADISQPEPQEVIIGGEQGSRGGTTNDSNFDETLVQSTILVAGDEVSSPRSRCEQGGSDVDDDLPDRPASASAEEAGDPIGALHDSLEQEQGVFVSDDDSLSVPSANGSGTPSSENVLNGAGEASSQLRNHPPERPTHSPSFLPLLSPTRTCLDEAVAALVSSESTAGLEFIARQGIAYKRIFREAFSLICGCKCLFTYFSFRFPFPNLRSPSPLRPPGSNRMYMQLYICNVSLTGVGKVGSIQNKNNHLPPRVPFRSERCPSGSEPSSVAWTVFCGQRTPVTSITRIPAKLDNGKSFLPKPQRRCLSHAPKARCRELDYQRSSGHGILIASGSVQRASRRFAPRITLSGYPFFHHTCDP